MTVNNLVDLNVLLNITSATLLVLGYVQIKRGNKEKHKKFMLAALTSTVLFLASYLTYHYFVGSVPYPYHDWTRWLYFTILIPHVTMAALQVPFIIKLVWHAFHDDFQKHKRLARIVRPVWMCFPVSGVVVSLWLHIF